MSLSRFYFTPILLLLRDLILRLEIRPRRLLTKKAALSRAFYSSIHLEIVPDPPSIRTTSPKKRNNECKLRDFRHFWTLYCKFGNIYRHGQPNLEYNSTEIV